MIPVPEWAKEVIHTTACIPCDHLYRDSDVTGIGMRHVGDGRVCLCVECRCPRCHRQDLLALINRPMDIRSFIVEIAELGDIEDYRQWAVENATLKFYPEAQKDRTTAVHHLHTDGEGWADTRYTELRLTTSLSKTGIVMKIVGMSARVPEAQVDVLGGYQCGESTVIAYRHGSEKIRIHDNLLKLWQKGRVLLRGFEEERLEPPDWSRFARLTTGTQFQLSGKTWTKLSTSELSALIGVGVWTVQKRRKT